MKQRPRPRGPGLRDLSLLYELAGAETRWLCGPARLRARCGRRAAVLRLRAAHGLAEALPALGVGARLRHRPAADRAGRRLVLARRAVLPAEIDDLQVQRVPAIAREHRHQIALDLLDGAGARQLPASGE